MTSYLRILLVAAALLSSGALEVASAIGESACCEGETSGEHGPCTDCPPGLACACCPIRAAIESVPVVAPPAPSGVALAVTASEPVVGPPVTDIFHPPRA